MKVMLAGFNVDHSVLKGTGKKQFTPETLSAAYARISRSSKPVHALREQARREVKKARASNKTIIFKMGHHSVAEHATFNFDIIGISRKAVEELEQYRLCSFTEKSQRYVTCRDDFLVPQEIEATPLKDDCIHIIVEQNNFYKRLFKKITEYNYSVYSDKKYSREKKKVLENRAKEDARYILSLATETQLGMTVNARNLELMIRRFVSHPLHEIRSLGNALYERASRIAPSLLLFCEANPYDQKTYDAIAKYTGTLKMPSQGSRKNHQVRCVSHTRNADNEILAALLFHTSHKSFSVCRRTVRCMSRKQKHELFMRACKHAEFYDTMLREFEQAYVTYQLIVSAGCFGQLKRHRMATLLCQAYDPTLGVTIPESVKKVGEETTFLSIIKDTEKVYRRIMKKHPHVGSYVLTNAHRRRVLMSVNLRELYHISRLREDHTAQWDIRNISRAMTKCAKKIMPICGQLLGGKDEYPVLYKKVFNRFPKVKP